MHSFNYKLLLAFILTIFLFTPSQIFAKDINQYSTNSMQPITSSKCNEFTFDATGSYDPDSQNFNYIWDFGDGTRSSDPIVTHIYDKSGDYVVELSVTDEQGLECSTGLTSQLVHVNIPPYAEFITEEKICTDQEVIFDATPSYDDGNTPLSYTWNFGDNTQTANGVTIVKKYTKGGNYNVSLVVDDGDDSVCNQQTRKKKIHVNEPPIAEAGENSILKCITTDSDYTLHFDGSKSSDVNKDRLTYLWDFGDGQKGNGKTNSHTFKSTGNYDVKLIVNDSTNLGCGTGIDFINVRLNKAPKAEAGEDIIGCLNEEITFDGTNSFAEQKGTLNALWHYGDGNTLEGLKTIHAYRKAGQYKAKLIVKNQLNKMCPPSSDIKNVFVNSSPTVAISAPEAVCLGTKVSFDATSASDPDGDSLEYFWSFGDGTILKGGSKVTHDYKQGGQYRISVVVDDGKKSNCSTSTAETMVHVNTPPIVDAGLNLSCCIDQSTTFDASASTDADGNNLSFRWHFGDNQTASGSVVNHTYTTSGKFDVKVTIDDGSGTSCSSATAGFTAEVNSTPVPVINIR
jgi:PKD repeat protein